MKTTRLLNSVFRFSSATVAALSFLLAAPAAQAASLIGESVTLTIRYQTVPGAPSPTTPIDHLIHTSTFTVGAGQEVSQPFTFTYASGGFNQTFSGTVTADVSGNGMIVGFSGTEQPGGLVYTLTSVIDQSAASITSATQTAFTENVSFGNAGTAPTFSNAGTGTINCGFFLAGFQPGQTMSQTIAFVLADAGGAPEIVVEQPTGTDISDGGSKDMGTTDVGSSTRLTFRVKNIGAGNLTGLTFNANGGSNPGDFVITNNLNSPIAGPAGTDTFFVTFTPGGAGARSCTIQLVSNDADENPFDITLTGTGVAVTGPAGTNAQAGAGTAGSFDWPFNSLARHPVTDEVYGFWRKDSGATALYSLIKWTGAAWSVIGTFGPANVIANFQAADYTSVAIDSTGKFHVAISGSIGGGINSTRGVWYGTSATGATGTWTFTQVETYSDPSGWKNTSHPVIKVDTNNRPHIAFDFDDVNGTRLYSSRYRWFDGAVWQGAGAAGDVYVQSGNASNEVNEVNLALDSNNKAHFVMQRETNGTGRDASLIYINNVAGPYSAPVTLAAGATDQAQGFNPNILLDAANKVHVVAGNYLGHLTYYNNVSGAFATTRINGNATGSVGTECFSRNSAGDLFLVYYAGTAFIGPLHYARLPGGTGSTWTIGQMFPSPVSPADGVNFFSGILNNAGLGVALFDYSPAPGAPPRNLHGATVQFAGLANPEIAVEQPAGTDLTDNASSVAFGAVNVLDTLPLTFTIKNTDLTASLSVGAITFDGANAGEFSVTTPPPATVGPNSSTTFVVTFKPLNDGARAAAMHIVNGDSSENPFDITLTGTGKPVVGGTWPGTPILTTTGPFDATGLTFDTELGFVPTPGAPIVFIHADGGVTGQFNDLPDGGVVAMAIGGVIYYFQVDYTGNDITLTNFTPSGPPEWRWAAGPNSRNNIASFGTINVPAGTNNPGARQGGMNWRGADGSLWMFGGLGYTTAGPPTAHAGLNDLWQYDRTLGQWIWRSGTSTQSAAGVYGTITVEAAGNTPRARHTGTTWTDDSGNLWLFGGVSGTARNNDLWRYNPTTGLWAWMKGSNSTGGAATYGTLGTPAAANTPGARQGAVGWFTPDGNLWLFGGFTGTAYHNDLWRYNIVSGNWTWMGGSNTTGAFGTYGTQGTPNAANVPGARRDATGWVAANGDLWLFGGLGLPAAGAAGNLNDLWRYNRGIGQWTWMKGTNTINPAGVYGTQGTPNAANTPGGRSGGSGWSTIDGKFWLVGGFINSSTMYNDVWIYDTVTNNWVWHLGDNTTNAVGVYGTLGVAAPGNKPGARFTPSTWVTLNGALWIFGGGGVDAAGTAGKLSDLWSYSIPAPAGAPPLPAPEPFPAEFMTNEDPQVSNASADTMAYVPISGQLTGTDSDGDIVLFNAVGSIQSQGTLSLQTNGQWVYTPAPGFVGTTTFSFKASDYYGGESPVRTLVITVATNPADSDNDGIADTYEQSHLGGTGADALGDADLDGQSNYFEFLAGTDPQDGNESLTTVPGVAGVGTSSGSIKLRLNHVRPGVNYHLETSTDLDAWSRIGTFTFSVAGSAEIEDPTPATGVQRFYRMTLEATPAVIVP